MVDEALYHNKLKQDGGVILLVLGLLYFSETYIVYNILSILWGEVPALGTIWPIYIVFYLLLIGIETIGCVRVYNSIKEHMFDFEYYD
ncbi:monomethylamine transporter [Methanococcoides sp. NM1]|uniref:monomethylamine transporter n=1 Tax=Methanococcoides sp. NM1 TaxID=1201013 RepID=UPI001083BFF7|nr:monomethylamine transporter [Methanococcoides sp. NM1]